MAKYIKCEAVLELIRPDDPNDERCAVTVATAKRLIRHALTVAPAADVAPVVHGRWIHSRYEDCSEQFELVKCSQCNHEAYAMAFYVRGGNYCPNCGAKMDGGDSDEAD